MSVSGIESQNIKIERADKSTESLEKEEEILKAMKEFKSEEEDTALESLESVDTKTLAGFIEKQLQDGGKWLSYRDMISKPYYAFMVQAALDIVSDKMVIDTEEDDESEEVEIEINGSKKTIDEHLADLGGIDDVYGGGTRKLVKAFQKIVGIHEDGAAGPQTMAHICAILKDTELTTIEVQGQEQYKYSEIKDIKNYINKNNNGSVKDGETVKNGKLKEESEETKKADIMIESMEDFDDKILDYLRQTYGEEVRRVYKKIEFSWWSGTMDWKSANSTKELQKFLTTNKKVVSDVLLQSYILYKSIDGINTNEDLIYTVFKVTNCNLQDIKDTYKKMSGNSLMNDLNGDLDDSEREELSTIFQEKGFDTTEIEW